MSAGVLPFSIRNGQVFFLFRFALEGRKAGFLADFGGASEEGESYRETATREFVEETGTMYFEDDLESAFLTPERVEAQVPIMADFFQRTLSKHPGWWCRRQPGQKTPPKDWRTYFVEVPWKDVEPMNRQWQLHAGGRFKKRQQILWLDLPEVRRILAEEPERLWKRLRQLIDFDSILAEIAVSTRH